MSKTPSVPDSSAVERLVAAALDVRQRAYAPYSKFLVGAALLTEGNRIFTGCNVENVSYGLAICAERVAIGKAISEGFRTFEALVVATSSGGSPCGACRQVIAEFVPAHFPVLLIDDTGTVHETLTLDDLLPHRFDLPDDFRHSPSDS